MLTHELRQSFLSFFARQGHEIVASSPLLPQNDPTLLFANAGMNQFKDLFLGNETRAYKRATTAQKCVRAGGKHNDLENVGFTSRHHTFFEMLGNFSFGDYFKKDAIHFAWEFTTRELGLPRDRLYVSVHVGDDEAADIWHKQEGIPRDRIFRYDADNFWAMGDTGPCGPCSEIFLDRGDKYGAGSNPEENGEKFIEFWNLVFMQFNRDADGKMHPLPKPSVDTGAGLERMASLVQRVETNFDIDIFRSLTEGIATLAPSRSSPANLLSSSYRVIADHARATAFLISDGILPSNEGRGYVLRRIMRRAIRHGKKLGIEGPFFSHVCSLVIEQMKGAYPDLADKISLVKRAVLAEEEQFLKTLERGLGILDEELKTIARGGQISGETAFKLYDTYGFPLDLTRSICSESGVSVHEAGFERAMDRQRQESRKHWKGSGDSAISEIYHKLAKEFPHQRFMGFEMLETRGICKALLEQKGEAMERIQYADFDPLSSDGKVVEAVFDITPFYGESGGQVGDHGKIIGDGLEAEVLDVQKPLSELTVCRLKIKKGRIRVGESYVQIVSESIRRATARNHTATHLLHFALGKVLGPHVKQAGSLVTPEMLRFDFSHFQALTKDEIENIENLVNEKIWADSLVEKKEMPKEEAMKSGAVAFFGDKYGERVRVVTVGNYSSEFCGGTHVDRSSDIHLLKIISESGIASGVRRIVARTSQGAFDYLRGIESQAKAIRDRLKASSVSEVISKIDKMAETERELRRELEQASSKNTNSLVDGLISQAKKGKGIRAVIAKIDESSGGVRILRDLAENLKSRGPDLVGVLFAIDTSQGKASIVTCAATDAQKVFPADKLIRVLSPLIEGRGGGKPDLAQAGGSKLDSWSTLSAAALKELLGE